MSKKRDRLSIVAAVLKAADSGLTKTGIMGEANLNYASLQKYLKLSISAGLSIDGSGNVYVADSGNNRIQKFSPLTVESGPSIVLSPTTGPSGTDCHVVCSGFVPYTDITITLPWGYPTYTGKTDGQGILDSLTVQVPTDINPETYPITATGTVETAGGQEQQSVTAYFTVQPLNTLVFDIISSPQTAGTPFQVKITAMDYQGNTLTSFHCGFTLTCSNNAAISPSSSTSGWVNGVWTGNLRIDSPANDISITLEASNGASGTSNSFDVVTGGLEVVPEPPFWLVFLCVAAAIALVTIYKKHSAS